MSVVAKASGSIFQHRGHGVWVPAFAGTTMEWLLPHSRPASGCELLLGRQRLLHAQFVARQFADRRAWQFVDEIERHRKFMLAELAGEEGAQIFQRDRLCFRAQ